MGMVSRMSTVSHVQPSGTLEALGPTPLLLQLLHWRWHGCGLCCVGQADVKDLKTQVEKEAGCKQC